MNAASVLVVDDSEVIRKGIAEKLSSFGFDVSEAADGDEALMLARSAKFDVVISDIVLPKIDGIKVLKFFRENCPDVPVILITGHATLETAIEAIRERAFDYLLKPFDLSDLVNLTKEALAYTREKGNGSFNKS
ncbi:MAG TPA: response regulator, partial [Deltaproteobacteria bacterium]|nr:response regulator [Deltaproteobacteria bacterium]